MSDYADYSQADSYAESDDQKSERWDRLEADEEREREESDRKREHGE